MSIFLFPLSLFRHKSDERNEEGYYDDSLREIETTRVDMGLSRFHKDWLLE